MEYNYCNPDSEISSLALTAYKASLAGNRQLLIYLDAMRVKILFSHLGANRNCQEDVSYNF